MSGTDLDSRLPCRTETRLRLQRLKQGTERYDDVLVRLLEEHEEDT